MFLKTKMAGSVCWESTRKECSMVNKMVYIDVGPFISRVRLDGTPAVIAGTSTPKVIAGTSTMIAGTAAIPVLLLMRFRCSEDFEDSFLQFVQVGMASSLSCLGYLRRGSALIDKTYP